MRNALSLALVGCVIGLGSRGGFVVADPPPPDPKAPSGKEAPKSDAGDDAAPREERGLAVGTVAPPLDVAGWVNVADGSAPTPASMKGKVIFLEFWETKCGPCIRQMPKVQEFHDRFASSGLVVLGICWEGSALVERFSKEHEVTFPMGIDPSKSILEAYQVKSFPTSYVIGRDGKVAAVTFPAGAQDDVENALGFGVDLPSTLTDYLDAMGRKDAKASRLHLERLNAKAAGGPVDLKGFALKAGGIAPADGKPPLKVDGPKSLTDLARARAAGDAARAKAVLDGLAAGGSEKQDLVAWARDLLARDYPVTAKELTELVAAKRFDTVISTILDRRPPAGAVDGIAKSEELQSWCAKQASDTRKLGRRGLLAELFVLRTNRGWVPKSQESSNDLFHELSSSSWVEDKTTRGIIGIDIDGEMLFTNTVAAFVDRSYARALVMESLVAGKRPDLAKVAADGAKLRKSTTDALKTKYGG